MGKWKGEGSGVEEVEYEPPIGIGSQNKQLARMKKGGSHPGSVVVSFPRLHNTRCKKDPRLGAAQRLKRDLQASQREVDADKKRRKKEKRPKDEKLPKNKEKFPSASAGSGGTLVQSGSTDGSSKNHPKPKLKKWKLSDESLAKFNNGLRRLKKHVRENPELYRKGSLVKSWEGRLKNMKENEEWALRDRDLKCARAALASYNKKHATKYELVETMGSYAGSWAVPGVRGFIWFHCNFRAQPKKGSSSDGSSSKLFFAELCGIQTLDVHSCVILEDLDRQAIRRCQICHGPMTHPVNGCKAGFPGPSKD